MHPVGLLACASFLLCVIRSPELAAGASAASNEILNSVDDAYSNPHSERPGGGLGKCVEKTVSVEEMCHEVVQLEEPYSCPKREKRVACRPQILQVPRVCHRVGMRWIEKPCNLVDYELKCSKRLIELPGKCTKEWTIQQPYPCALSSTVEECTVQDIQVSDQCTKSVVKPVSFNCVKETFETYCEGQLEFITLPQTPSRTQPKDHESWRKNKIPHKVFRKMAQLTQGKNDDTSPNDSFPSIGGGPMCHRKAQRHVPYACSRPRMRQNCKVIKQMRKRPCIKEEQYVKEFDCSYTETKRTCSSTATPLSGVSQAELTSTRAHGSMLGTDVDENAVRGGTLPSGGDSTSPTNDDIGSLASAAEEERNSRQRHLRALAAPAVLRAHSVPICVEMPVRVQKTCTDVSLKKADGECETEVEEKVCETVKDAEPDTCYMVEEFDETYVCQSEPMPRQLVPSNCKTRSVKRKELCTKTLPFTEEFPCQTKVPATTCSPVEKIDATTCYRAAKKTMEYSCVKSTEVEECVPIPTYLSGKCFDQEEYKEAYECSETQVRQKCEELEKEVASRCDKVVKQKLSYPCQKTALKKVCPGREPEISATNLITSLSTKENDRLHPSLHNLLKNEPDRTKYRISDSTTSSVDPVTQHAALAALSLAHTVAGAPSSSPERSTRPKSAAGSSQFATDRPATDGSRYNAVGTRARRLLPAFKPWGLKSKKEPAPYYSSTVQLPVPPPPPGGVYFGPRAYGINEFNRKAAVDSTDIPTYVGEDGRVPPPHVVDLNDVGNQHRLYYITNPRLLLPPVPSAPLPPTAFHSLLPTEDHTDHDMFLDEHPRNEFEASSEVLAEGSPAPLAPLAPGSPVPSLLTDVTPPFSSKSEAPASGSSSNIERAASFALEEHQGDNHQSYLHGYTGKSRSGGYSFSQQTSPHVQTASNPAAPELHLDNVVGKNPHLVDRANISDGSSLSGENLSDLHKEYLASAYAAHHCNGNSCTGHRDKAFHPASTSVAISPFIVRGALPYTDEVTVLPVHDAVHGSVVSDHSAHFGGKPNFEVAPHLHRIQQLITEIHYLMQNQRTQGGHLTDHQRQRLEAIIGELETFAGTSTTAAFLLPDAPVGKHLSRGDTEDGTRSPQSDDSWDSFGPPGSGTAAPVSEVQPEKLRELLKSLLSELRTEEESLTRAMNITDRGNDPLEEMAQELELIRDDIEVVEDGLSRLERGDLSKNEMQSLWQFLLGDDTSQMDGLSPDVNTNKTGDIHEAQDAAEPTPFESSIIKTNPEYKSHALDHTNVNTSEQIFVEDEAGSAALAAAAAALHTAMRISVVSPITSFHHEPQPITLSSHVAASPRDALMKAILQGAFDIKARILRSMHALQHLLETTDMPADREREAQDLLDGLKRDIQKMHQIVDRVQGGELSLGDLQYIAIQLEAIRQKAQRSDEAQAERTALSPYNQTPSSGGISFSDEGPLSRQPEQQGYLNGGSDPASATDLASADGAILSSQGRGAVASTSGIAEPFSERKSSDFSAPSARTNVYITINIDETGSVTAAR
ncbi:putative toxoplasma gondii family D protein [Toxoplasma gondii GAB2-2007-GAL-DOM2]|uniref:Toxoplasma gondii family D protein n=2 Tax=Toxoplasma gondii TaxID=5811 RepID=V4Z8X4_TOXGV|nr:putative toxoplasma gondii family D protein [Toxoplasma gondii VEG]KFG35395.1 putative toxoplasma gondii family D protein [Toxoplasma gondii GAB2-2007-GAL-DOM2]